MLLIQCEISNRVRCARRHRALARKFDAGGWFARAFAYRMLAKQQMRDARTLKESAR